MWVEGGGGGARMGVKSGGGGGRMLARGGGGGGGICSKSWDNKKTSMKIKQTQTQISDYL